MPVIGFGVFVFLIIAIFGGSNGGQAGNLGNTLAYLSVINEQAAAHRVPPLWAIADVAWESSGNWLATNDNKNGTTDAGLCQINSVNWSNYDLQDDPYDVNKNLRAGATILGNAYERYGNIQDALYAYNGGTPQNGMTYNPSYAPNVATFYNMLTSDRLLARVQSYDYNVLTLTVGQAIIVTHTSITTDGNTSTSEEQTGEEIPPSITVTVIGKNGDFGPVKIMPKSGEVVGLPKEATVFQVVNNNGAFAVGDQISIATSKGYSTKIFVTDSEGGGSITAGTPSAHGYSWPVPGHFTITSLFGPRIHPVTHQVSFHEGVDISAEIGTQIIAPKDGVVDSVNYNDPFYGYYIYLRHNDGTFTFYGHVQTIEVFPGSLVKAGDIIATVGTRGLSTGPHLHFGVKQNGQWLDPLGFVNPS